MKKLRKQRSQDLVGIKGTISRTETKMDEIHNIMDAIKSTEGQTSMDEQAFPARTQAEGQERCVTREVGPSMPYQSAKAETIEQGSHTSHEESEGTMDGTCDIITKAINQMQDQTGREDKKKPTQKQPPQTAAEEASRQQDAARPVSGVSGLGEEAFPGITELGPTS